MTGTRAATGTASTAGVLHLRCAPALSGEGYREVLELLREFSPLVQALPPRAALVQVRGAQRYFGAGPARIAEVIRLRAVARLGTDVRIGVGGAAGGGGGGGFWGGPGRMDGRGGDGGGGAPRRRGAPAA
ncbi:hypothetical protein AB0E73_32705, partial [Streptomyces sp. NPDC031705]